MPYISVTVTSYNYGKYIIRQLESIYSQTFRDFEIVVADDGSTDNSVKLIEEFIRSHNDISIRLIKSNHAGLQANRNRVLEAATGKYVMFCDSDDYMDPDCLEQLAREAKEIDADRVVCHVRDVNEKGKVLQIEEQWGSIPSKWMCNLNHGCLYRRSIFFDYNIRFVDAASADDFCISSIYNCYAKRVGFVKKPLYNWFVHSDSTSGAKKTINEITGSNMLFRVLKQVRGVRNFLFGNQKDWDLFIYQTIRFYYFSIFHCYRYVSIKDTLKDYKYMHNAMISFYKRYLSNPYINLKRKSPARRYAQMIIWVSALLERTRMMPVALIIYHFISKVHYFNV